MSETKFTKGEWSVEDGRVVVCGDFKIAYSYSGLSVPFIEHIKTNANLIAAAPEMYEMLDEVSNVLGHELNPTNKSYIKAIKELLAKARGEK